ncbi:MAG TPA: hypothetical protein VFP58_02375, partial [Candidatus Eisenbacteria bacterium]|nr:hypothetical protein [Candidatus Eisenbacteria bacterium]
RPTLGGHQFVSTDLVPDAFVRTYVRNSLGYTMTPEFDYPPIVVGGDTLLTLDGSLAYALLGMEYQHAVRDWIAVRVGLGLRTRLGTQASSLITEGVNVTSGIELGWLARLHEGSRTSLVGSLDVTRQTLTVIDLRQFAEDVIDGDPDPSLIDNVPTVRSSAGLRFAYALSRTFGATLLAEGSYGESPRRDEVDSWEHGFGASVDLDGGAAWDVPIGLVLAYRQTSLPVLTTSDHGSVRQTLLRIAYTGDSDFLVALDVTGVLDRENREADSVWAGGAAFSLRHYF